MEQNHKDFHSEFVDVNHYLTFFEERAPLISGGDVQNALIAAICPFLAPRIVREKRKNCVTRANPTVGYQQETAK